MNHSLNTKAKCGVCSKPTVVTVQLASKTLHCITLAPGWQFAASGGDADDAHWSLICPTCGQAVELDTDVDHPIPFALGPKA